MKDSVCGRDADILHFAVVIAKVMVLSLEDRFILGSKHLIILKLKEANLF